MAHIDPLSKSKFDNLNTMRPMQDRLDPPNPFTREGTRMRRNTRDSRWVTPDVENGRSGRQHPGKTVAFVTQQSTPAEPNAGSPGGRSDSTTSREQAISPVLHAAIHNTDDLKILPAIHTRLPSVRSWSSLRSSLVDDEAIPPRTITFQKIQYDPEVSPLEHEVPTHWDTPDSRSDAGEAAEDRKESNATIFPGPGATFKRPEAKSTDPPNLASFFRVAKEVYNIGPRGEGQKLWSGYTGFRKGRQVQIEMKQDLPEQMPTTRRPSEGLSYHPPSASLPPERQVGTEERAPLSETLYTRKDSDPSRTSYEVLIRMYHGGQQYVDRSKPLPPAPLLQPAPKGRQQGYDDIELKPLPLTPRTRSIAPPSSQADRAPVPRVPLVVRGSTSKSQQSSAPDKPSDLSKPVSKVSTQSQHATGEHKPAQSSKDKSSNTKASHWWTHLVELTSEDYHPPPLSSSKPPLKPLISRPRPITALQEGRTVNLSPSCGGVGGPGAVTPANLHPSSSSKGKDKGKQKAVTITPPSSPGLAQGNKHKNWLGKLGSPLESSGLTSDGGGNGSGSGKKTGRDRRRESDLSFICAGVEEGSGAYVDVRDPRPSRQRDGGVRRDTGFYGAYEGVLREYEK